MQMEGARPVVHVQDEETAGESVLKKQQQAVISTLTANIAKMHLEKAKSDDAVKELHDLRAKAQEREQAFREAKKR